MPVALMHADRARTAMRWQGHPSGCAADVHTRLQLQIYNKLFASWSVVFRTRKLLLLVVSKRRSVETTCWPDLFTVLKK